MSKEDTDVDLWSACMHVRSHMNSAKSSWLSRRARATTRLWETRKYSYCERKTEKSWPPDKKLDLCVTDPSPLARGIHLQTQPTLEKEKPAGKLIW